MNKDELRSRREEVEKNLEKAKEENAEEIIVNSLKEELDAIKYISGETTEQKNKN